MSTIVAENEASFLSKDIVSRSNAPRKISKIQFGTLQTADIQRMSEVQVMNRSIFTPASAENPHRMPSESGPHGSTHGGEREEPPRSLSDLPKAPSILCGTFWIRPVGIARISCRIFQAHTYYITMYM